MTEEEQKLALFRDLGYDPNKKKELPKTIAPFLAGAGQGVVSDFADEIYGAGKSLLPQSLGGTDYETGRDEARQYFQSLQQENPEAYTAGNITGAIGQNFVPGLGVVGKGKTIANILKSGGLGALQGLGASEGQTIGDIAQDTAFGGATGLVFGGAGEGLAKGGSYLAGKAGNVRDALVKKIAGEGVGSASERAILNVGAGLSPDQYNAIVSNPQAIAAAATDPLEKVAKDLVETRYNPLREAGNYKYQEAFSKLRDSIDPEQGAISKTDLLDQLGKIKNSTEFDLDEGGKKVFQQLESSINKAYPNSDAFLSEKTLETLKNAVGGKVKNWNKLTQDPEVETAWKTARGIINSHLKNNPEYEAAMIPVRQYTESLQNLKKNYGLERIFNETGESSVRPTDLTKTRLKQLMNREVQAEDLARVEDLFKGIPEDIAGRNIGDRVSARRLYEQTSAGAPQGSAQTNLGADVGRAVVGAGLGYAATEDPYAAVAFGGGAGALGGRILDKYGQQGARSYLLRKYGNAVGQGSSQGLERLGASKFAPVLEAAIKRGPQAYAVQDYILSQKDPEYRKIKGEQR